MINRRQFQRGLSALALGGALPGRAVAAAGDAGPFSFLALGDVHYDRLEHHDYGWLRDGHEGDIRQVQNYCRITVDTLPGLLDALRDRADAGGPAPVRFVAQLGDLIEGMCGRPELADRQCRDAVAYLRDASIGVPFLAAKGNHEIQGPGAAEAYDRALRPYLAEQSGAEPAAGASVAVERGDCLFAFLDAYVDEGLDWLAGVLDRRSARHVFVLLHPPVVPFGARSTWHLYARDGEADRRDRLLDLLGEHRAIALTGHLHRYGVVVRETPRGRFLQLALCSVLPRPDVEPADVVEGVAAYGPDLVRLEPDFSPSTVAERRAALAAEAPFIRHYEHADAPGFAAITVDGPTVRAEVVLGSGREPWKTLDLTAIRDEAGR